MVVWLLFVTLLALILISRGSEHPPRWQHFLVLLVFMVFSGLRYKVGYDYDNYIQIYYQVVGNLTPDGLETTWTLLNRAVSLFGSPQLIFLVTSVVVYRLILDVFRDYSASYRISIIVFFLAIYLYWESLSILRQSLAIAFVLVSFRYFEQRKLVLFTTWALVAISFHFTALIALPLFFVSRLRLPAWGVSLLLLVSPFALEFVSFLLSTSPVFAKYQVYLDGSLSLAARENTGLSLVLKIILVFLLLALRKSLGYETDERTRIILNLYFLGMVMYIGLYSSTGLRRVSYYALFFEPLIVALVWTMKSRLSLIVSFLRYTYLLLYFALLIGTFFNDVLSKSFEPNARSLYNYSFELNLPGNGLDKNSESIR